LKHKSEKKDTESLSAHSFIIITLHNKNNNNNNNNDNNNNNNEANSIQHGPP